MSVYSDAVLADSPLLYLRLDETSGASCANIGSLGGSATCNGTYARNQASIHANLGVAASKGGANSDYFSYPDNAALDLTGTLTYECWAKHTGSNYGVLMCKNRQNSSTMGCWLRVVSDRSIRMGQAGSGAFAVQTASSVFPADGAWHHVVGTKSGTTWTIYLDGTQVAQATSAITLQATNKDFWVGNYTDEFPSYVPFTGHFDEVAVYSTALGADRVAAHYAARNAAAALPFVPQVVIS